MFHNGPATQSSRLWGLWAADRLAHLGSPRRCNRSRARDDRKTRLSTDPQPSTTKPSDQPCPDCPIAECTSTERSGVPYSGD